MRQREIGFVDVPIYRSAAAAVAAATARRSKNPSNGFGGEKMRFTFGVDLTRAMLLQY